MSELYPPLRRPEQRPRNVLTRMVDAVVAEWRKAEAEAFPDRLRDAEPGAYLAEAERFMDQFLIAYFYSIILVPKAPPAFPWKMLCDLNPWLWRMPELWQETKDGVPLTRTQLDYVGGLLYERLKGA